MSSGRTLLSTRSGRALLGTAIAAASAGAYLLAPDDRTPLLVLLVAAVVALVLAVVRRGQLLATLRSQAEEILRQRDAFREGGTRLRLLESAVLHAQDAVVVLDAGAQGDPGRSVLFVNDAFCRMTGYDRADLIGRSLHFLRGPASDPATLERLRGRRWPPARRFRRNCSTTARTGRRSGSS